MNFCGDQPASFLQDGQRGRKSLLSYEPYLIVLYRLILSLCHSPTTQSFCQRGLTFTPGSSSYCPYPPAFLEQPKRTQLAAGITQHLPRHNQSSASQHISCRAGGQHAAFHRIRAVSMENGNGTQGYMTAAQRDLALKQLIVRLYLLMCCKGFSDFYGSCLCC